MSDTPSSSTPASTPSAPATTSNLSTTAAGNAKGEVAVKNASKAPNTSTVQSSTPETVADAKAVINDPNAPKAAKVEAKKMLKQLTLKVDGQDYTENLPFEIPDTNEAREFMTRELQMSKMGQKRAQHASALQKDVEKLINQMKEDPFKLLADPLIGVDVKDAIKKYIEKEIENSNKSPEQLALEAAKEELRLLKEQQETEKKTREQQEQQALADKYEQEYDTQITQALNSSKIPKSPLAVQKVLAWAEIAVKANKNVTIDDIIPFVQEELINDYRAHAAALPDEALEEFFGKEVVNRLRKTAVKKVKAAAQNPALKAPAKVPSTGKATEPENKDDKKVTYKQFFKPW